MKNNTVKFSYVSCPEWHTTWEEGKTHRFVVSLGDTNNTATSLYLAAITGNVAECWTGENVINPEKIVAQQTITISETKTLTLDVVSDYDNVILWKTGGGDWSKVNISSITREVLTPSSNPSGKSAVSYAIPGEVETEMKKYSFENGDDTGRGGSFSGKGQSSDDSYAGSHNLWLKNDNFGENDYSSQIYLDLNSSEWPVGTKITLSFYAKGCDDFEVNTASGRDNGMKIAVQENQSPWNDCGVFTSGVKITKEWAYYEYQTTINNNASPNRIYFNCGNYKGSFRFDDIIITKTTNAASGGSNEFTSDAQVANIASSEFSSLEVGDYICADVTGSPETIKLNNYNLTQFNGSNLWGIKATAAMVTALKANDSQFKGHDLTLNEISIYKTKTISETADDNGIALVNNTFVEQNRPFAANKWNTVCLPYKPTAAQATLLFGTGYQISQFTGVSGTTLEFTNLASIDDFVAGRPYLVMPGTGYATSTVELEDVNITAATPETVTYRIDEKDYSFSGTFNTKSFAETKWSTTRFVSNNLLMTPNSTDAMKGLRCYFTLPAPDGARSFSLGFDEEGGTTGVADINRETITNNGDFFNLAGQRVAQPTKGLYIVNGKKVVIK